MNKRVYLIGPITGCSYGECTDWRDHAKEILGHAGIIGVSPMRAKEYLAAETDISKAYDTPLSSARGLTTRDRFDLMTCDIVFANLLGADKVSVGTVMEVAWADILRKPVVLVMEEEGNPHDHPMITECIGFRLDTLEGGLEVVKAILTY